MFGLFGDRLTRLKKAAREPYGQHDQRHDAMLKLFGMGTQEAYKALFSRFAVNVNSPQWDEKEKGWLTEQLALRADEPALRSALEEALMTADRLNPVIGLAKRCVASEDYIGLLRAAFELRAADHRAADAKVELISALGELGDESALWAGLAAVADRSDEVILAAVMVLEACDDDRASSALWGLAYDDLQMPRVVRRAGQALVRVGSKDPEGRSELPGDLAEDFVLSEGRLVSRR
jgi:HEAT repeat protein